MKRIRLMLAATLLCGTMLTTNSNAQVQCQWSVTDIVGHPTCVGLCNGFASVAPTVPGTYTYLWSNNNTTNSVSGLCEGPVTVSVTDGAGCSQQFTYNIVAPEPLVATCTILQDISSAGASDGIIEASSTGGTGVVTFYWQTNPVVIGNQLTNLPGGTYYVIAQDENDCQASSYCIIGKCVCPKHCDGFRTQTQGGWGQCHQNGSNPGTYLFANFAAAFPTGLTLGCDRTLTLTSAQGVCDFLPSTSTPRVLPVGALVDPGQTYSNVFAGQLATAMINVGFDVYDPDFSDAGVNLGDLIYNNGTFDGWSVNAVIAEANNLIGGCGSSYTASQLSNALAMFNENYTDGTIDNGNFDCPGDDRNANSVSNAELKMSVYPNPFSTMASLMINTAQDEIAEVEVYNVSGQKVAIIFKGEVKSSEGKEVTIDGTNLDAGIYLIKVVTPSGVQNQKVILRK